MDLTELSHPRSRDSAKPASASPSLEPSRAQALGLTQLSHAQSMDNAKPAALSTSLPAPRHPSWERTPAQGSQVSPAPPQHSQERS